MQALCKAFLYVLSHNFSNIDIFSKINIYLHILQKSETQGDEAPLKSLR